MNSFFFFFFLFSALFLLSVVFFVCLFVLTVGLVRVCNLRVQFFVLNFSGQRSETALGRRLALCKIDQQQQHIWNFSVQFAIPEKSQFSLNSRGQPCGILSVSPLFSSLRTVLAGISTNI